MSAESFDVVIIGAGAAGLAALRELDRAGKRVLCLEARDRIGGRIYTVHDPLSPIPIELGAEFVHGKPPEIVEVAESAPLALYKCMEHAVHVRNGKPVRNQEAWLQIGEVMDRLKEAVEAGREESFADFLAKCDYTPEVKELAMSYVEGFNAAIGNVISIASLVKDQEAADEIDGDNAFRLMNGYDGVPHWLVQGISELRSKLKLNAAVRSVKWNEGEAFVEFVSPETLEVDTVSARKAIFTVPLPILQAGSIRFEPEPQDILHAAHELAFGQVVRVVIRFARAIWEDRDEFAKAGFLLSNEEHFPTWWMPLPVRAASLTGWSAGPHATDLLELPKQEVIRRALCDLSRIIGMAQSKLASAVQAVYYHAWHDDPFARGAYSYVPAGSMGARPVLATPVGNTLYFAGEAVETNGHSATVHGAIASGRRAARQVLDD